MMSESAAVLHLNLAANKRLTNPKTTHGSEHTFLLLRGRHLL